MTGADGAGACGAGGTDPVDGLEENQERRSNSCDHAAVVAAVLAAKASAATAMNRDGFFIGRKDGAKKVGIAFWLLVAGLQVAGPESALGIPWKSVIIARRLTINLILKLTSYARSQLFMFQHGSE